ncbi:MAG: hypothetical protein KatS3mg013_0885 [Actinomycetota bacterium]|nr:MAG: hypothetical protein KatS3mg013_0885 [Actinomycetota bacterium]
MQRGHHYAIVDEVDSILIDEARTPLIISGQVADAAKLVLQSSRGSSRASRATWTTRSTRRSTRSLPPTEGMAKVEQVARDREPLRPRHHEPRPPPAQRVAQGQGALQARPGLRRRRRRGEDRRRVHRADLEGRRYSEGLHQAIEAKEGVRIKEENQTLATITIQNYFQMYEKLAGMTGTAQTEAAEFEQTYKLERRRDPHAPADDPGRPQDLIYKTEDAKFGAVADDIAERHATGQPVLVGTVSIEKSEKLSRSSTSGDPARRPQRQAPREGGRDRRPGRPQGRGDGRHEHGRPRRRHPAGRQPRVPRAPGHGRPKGFDNDRYLLSRWTSRSGPPTRPSPTAARQAQGRSRRRARRGRGPGRAVRARHRAPRVAPHRQPAPRALGPAGRSRRVRCSTCRSRTT